MKAIMFDLDGTLIDSMSVWANLDKLYVESKGLVYDIVLTEKLRACTIEDAPKEFAKFYNNGDDFSDMRDFMDDVISQYYNKKFKLKNGVIEMLKNLKSKGFKMCITTATNSDFALPCIERLGLLEFMDFVQCPDLVKVKKHESKFFEIALERLGTLAENTYVFDDAYYALENAKNLGITPIGVYDDVAKIEIEKVKAISKFFINDFDKFDINSL